MRDFLIPSRFWIGATILSLGILATPAAATQNYFQGFEVNTGDWSASQSISRVPSGGGTLHRPAAAGKYYAELKNLQDGYQSGYGDVAIVSMASRIRRTTATFIKQSMYTLTLTGRRLHWLTIIRSGST